MLMQVVELPVFERVLRGLDCSEPMVPMHRFP
jgi:hypothetical protein